MNSYEEGYYAGLVNERANPHLLWSFAWMGWQVGNSAGVNVHCAVVEAVYLKHVDDKDF
jgi:hypothetical protein